MKLNRLILFFVVYLSSVCSVSAWCIIGIGNTCGEDSRETNIISKYFNFNKPTPSDSFDIWGIGGFVGNVVNNVKNIFKTENIDDKPDYAPDNIYKKGDRIKNVDLNGEVTYTTFTDVTFIEVGNEEVWYYDLDVIQISQHQCIGCPSDNQNIPGFDYEFYLVIRNTGNVPADSEFTIEVIGEDPKTNRLYYNEVIHRPGFPTGTGIIPIKLYDIGLVEETKNQIEKSFIYQGVFDSQTLPFRVTVKLSEDDKEVEPGFVEFKKQIRECKVSSEGETKCTTKTEIVKEIIHAQYSDPFTDDTEQYTLNINKLTPDILGKAGLDLVIT